MYCLYKIDSLGLQQLIRMASVVETFHTVVLWMYLYHLTITNFGAIESKPYAFDAFNYSYWRPRNGDYSLDHWVLYSYSQSGCHMCSGRAIHFVIRHI